MARAVAERVGGLVLDKDLIRASVFPSELIEYSTKQDDLVVQRMLDEAEHRLRIQPARVIFLDGRPFSKKYQVDAVVQFAEQLETAWRIVECVCPEVLALGRLQADQEHVAGNRDAKLYHKVKADFQKIRRPKLVVQTTLPLEACVKRVEEYLQAE